LEKKELAVGDSTRVELIFSTGHYSSKVKKSARIMCNSAGTIPRLVISADVRKSMDSLDVYQIARTDYSQSTSYCHTSQQLLTPSL